MKQRAWFMKTRYMILFLLGLILGASANAAKMIPPRLELRGTPNPIWLSLKQTVVATRLTPRPTRTPSAPGLH